MAFKKAAKNTLLKTTLLSFMILLGIVLFAVACSFEWADIHAQQAYALMDKWEKSNLISSAEEWRTAFLHIRKSRRFNPSSTDYIIELGQLYEWAGSLVPFDSEKKRVFQLAVDEYRLAAKKRPTWPHCWANLAYAKMSSGEWDDELFKALSMAMEYGPWIKEVQQKSILVALSGWDMLPASTRDAAIVCMTRWLSLDKTDRHMEQFIIQTAVNANRTYLIDHLLTETRQRDLAGKLKSERYASPGVLEKNQYPIRRFDERFEV